MSNIGKLITFSRLLKEESVIMIPKVQRDYAYGRQESKVEEILDGMLSTMLTAVQDNKAEIFDFVYGGSYVKKNNESSGLIPLDGQQRLTTLFLLHFYASVIQQNVTSDEVECLKKFRYETRQSATDFCEALVGNIRNDIIKENSKGIENIKSQVQDNPKYLPSYNSDPTIVSMLNVLDKIETKCKEYEIENLWTKLINQDNIQFYSLSLDKFGLTDDLYIKMNSRGKKLTEFEIFKSDLEKAIKNISSDLKDQMSIKIDNSWMDLLWDYANMSEGGSDIVKKADDGYMCLFKNIFRIEMFRRGLETKTNRPASIDEIITDEDSIQQVMSIFDKLSEIQKDEGIQNYWNSYFYFSDNVIGKDDKIRLFWSQKQNQKPVFFLAMDRDLSVPEIVYFYSIYLIRSRKKEKNIALKCLRVIRNLVTANVRVNSARYDMLAGFLSDAENIINNDGRLSEGEHTFISTSCEEERYKTNTLNLQDYNSLLRYENHNILQGSIMLFIEQYVKDTTDTNELFKQLKHFEKIFNNDSPKNFEKIRIGFINDYIEYMQYEPSMENEESMTRRYFVHKADDLSQFFIKNERRRNQKAILEVLATKFTTLEELKEPTEKCKEFNVNSWRYYFTKYSSANIEDTKYGCYAWDDKVKKPLEMVILNSSYHSEYNIEWKMLNHILELELRENKVNYSLDNHASSPFVMNKYGVTFTITQNGWEVQCNSKEVIDAISNSGTSIAKIKEDENSNIYLINLEDTQCNLDYIDLAKGIIQDIEKAYSYIQRS